MHAQLSHIFRILLLATTIYDSYSGHFDFSNMYAGHACVLDRPPVQEDILGMEPYPTLSMPNTPESRLYGWFFRTDINK